MKRFSLEFFIYDSLLIMTIVFSYFAEIASWTVDQNVVGNIWNKKNHFNLKKKKQKLLTFLRFLTVDYLPTQYLLVSQ